MRAAHDHAFIDKVGKRDVRPTDQAMSRRQGNQVFKRMQNLLPDSCCNGICVRFDQERQIGLAVQNNLLRRHVVCRMVSRDYTMEPRGGFGRIVLAKPI